MAEVICPECSRSFTGERYLKAHGTQVHGWPRRVRQPRHCLGCRVVFGPGTPGQQRYCVICRPPRDPEFACPECGWPCVSQYGRNVHLSRKHNIQPPKPPKAVKPPKPPKVKPPKPPKPPKPKIVCPICDRRMAHQGALTIHQPACERKRAAAEQPKPDRNGGSPEGRAELDLQLRRLASWEDPMNDSPLAVTYRECLASADRRQAGAAKRCRAGEHGETYIGENDSPYCADCGKRLPKRAA
jgi:hypothetical protein